MCACVLTSPVQHPKYPVPTLQANVHPYRVSYSTTSNVLDPAMGAILSQLDLLGEEMKLEKLLAGFLALSCDNHVGRTVTCQPIIHKCSHAWRALPRHTLAAPVS